MDYSLIAKIFTKKNLLKLSWYGKSKATNYVYKIMNKKDATLREIVNFSYKLLQENYRIEYIYNSILFNKFKAKKNKLYFEFPTQDCIADCVYHDKVFEIKTAYDSLVRVTNQINNYYTCFTKLYICTSHETLDKIINHIPESVGIYTVHETLALFRKAEIETSLLNNRFISNHIHLKEKKIIYENYFSSPAGKKFSKNSFTSKIKKMNPIEVQNIFIEHLNKRKLNRFINLQKFLPESLHTALHCFNMRKSDWNGIISKLDKTFI